MRLLLGAQVVERRPGAATGLVGREQLVDQLHGLAASPLRSTYGLGVSRSRRRSITLPSVPTWRAGDLRRSPVGCARSAISVSTAGSSAAETARRPEEALGDVAAELARAAG